MKCAIRFYIAILITPLVIIPFLYCAIREYLTLEPMGSKYYMRHWPHPKEFWWYKSIVGYFDESNYSR